MTSLMDIGELTPAAVTLRGKQVEVHGITAETILRLLESFPELQKVMAGTPVSINAGTVMKSAPNAVASIIAAATGKPDKPKEEFEAAVKIAGTLTIGEQADVLKAIWDITFPRGVGSFKGALAALGVSAEFGWALPTGLPGQSNS